MKLALLSLLLGACIPMMPASSSQPTASAPAGDPSYASSPSSSSSAAAPAPSARSAPSAPAAPSSVSVSIRSSCGQTVRVFYGDKPKFGSGTTSSIDSNSVQSKSFRPGDMMWVVDEHDNGLASTTIGASTSSIDVACGGLLSR